MKRHLLIALTAFSFSFSSYAAHVIITNSGNSFAPANVQINLGDTVIFGITSSHNAREVSQSTWAANDTIALPGGFEVPYGGGIYVPTTLGDHYFVCVPHAQMHGMKGIIKVSQVGLEAIKPLNFQILQSTSEQKVELRVSGGVACEMHVEMMNLSGQIVRKVTMGLHGEETSAIIEVGDLPKGVYMIRWSCGNLNKAKKIILQ